MGRSAVLLNADLIKNLSSENVFSCKIKIKGKSVMNGGMSKMDPEEWTHPKVRSPDFGHFLTVFFPTPSAFWRGSYG